MAFKIGDLELITPGDIFIGGLAYGAAFAIDAFFFTDGATSAEVANAATMAALGTKYGVHAVWRRWRKKPRRRLLPKSDQLG
jgi:ABC-type Co2+ transport system permease subunit